MGDRVMADRITDSRERLYLALAPLLPPGRVSKYVPASVATPTMWIERHSWAPTREGSANLIAVSWRIVISTDAEKEQALLDELSAKVYDSVIRARFRAQFAEHQPIDIGGMSITALVVTVDDPIVSSTLCLPPAPVTSERLAPV